MIAVKDLVAHYGRARILDGVSFDVEEGELVALLGRNGAGKSTTLKSIMGLVRRTSGSVRFAGAAIGGLRPFQICRRGLGYVPEDRRVFSDLTVHENLLCGRQAPRGAAATWTHERIYELFPNLAERRNQPAGRMSGGEQQMLTVARTLMGNPSAILLDEPSEGLAPVIVQQMARIVMELKAQGVTILLSEQNLHFARAVADAAIVIEKGRIRYAGTMQELSVNESVRATYLTV